MKVWCQGKYTKRRVKHRVWWPRPGDTKNPNKELASQRVFPFNDFRRSKQQQQAWLALWKYLLYRDVWYPPGSEDINFYVRQPLLETEGELIVAKGYEKTSSPLRQLKTIGRFGVRNGEFNDPRGVALSPDESTVYVLDSGNARIQVFDKDLNFIKSFGSKGSGPGQLTINQYGNPNGGIGVGPDGTVFVTDTWAGTGRILRFDKDGNPLTPIVNADKQPFYNPRGLGVGMDGTLYVADTGHHQIAWYKPDGSFGGTIGKNEIQEPVGVTAAPDGLIYVCGVVNQHVVAFNKKGQAVKERKVLGWKGEGEYGYLQIEPYVAVDRAGNVYVTDSHRGNDSSFRSTRSKCISGWRNRSWEWDI